MSAAALIFAFLGTAWGQCTLLGAIRWDAWHGAIGGPGRAVEAALSPQQFQSRAPFCSRILSADRVEIDCAGQESMDRELQYAAEAGLDYWAFVAYATPSPMSLGLENYLNSDMRSLLRFSVILTPQAMRQPPDPLSGNLERFVEYASHPDYQRVLDDRPLFYFLPEGDFLHRLDNVRWLQDALKHFRSQVMASGGGNPYVVLMHFNPAEARRLMSEIGFDAISAYAVQRDRQAGTYGALAAEVRHYWEEAKASGAKVVPLIMTGWDRRPRVVNPVPWEKMYRTRPDEINYYYAAPTPAELAGHVADAVAWVNRNKFAAEADTAIIYAWNENDEGGWLVPTLGEGDARVKALGARIRQLCPGKSPRSSLDRALVAPDFDAID